MKWFAFLSYVSSKILDYSEENKMKALKIIRLNLAIIMLSVFLIGCGVRNVPKDYSLDDAGRKGVIVVSLTRSGMQVISEMYVKARGMDNDYKFVVAISSLITLSDFAKCAISIPEDKPCGRLAIIELPEGEYEFYSWKGSGGNRRMWSKEEFSLRFKVIAGKAVYLGNLNFWFLQTQWKMKVTDMRERDLPLLYQKNPSITPDLVVHDILQ